MNGSLNLLRACQRAGVKRVIFSSTGGAMYGDSDNLPATAELPPAPDSPCAIHSLAVEHYLPFSERLYGIKSVSLRHGNVYGPRRTRMGRRGDPIFARAMFDGRQPTIYGDGEQLRDYVYVDDVVDANMAALEQGAPHPINFGTGTGTSVNELYQRLAACPDSSTPPQYADPRAGEIRRCYLAWGLLTANRDGAPGSR